MKKQEEILAVIETNKKCPPKNKVENKSCKNGEQQIEIKEPKFTTTKKVLWLSWILFIALIVVNAFGIQTGVAMEIVGGVVTAITTGFYIWKSKAENKQKIALGLIESLADKYGIENVIALLNNILDE